MAESLSRGEFILAEMQGEGQRIRPLRRALVEIFSTRKLPLSFKEIQLLLEKRRVSHHRVSLHRELNFLISWKVIDLVSLADGSVRYEFTGHGHHHHFSCTKCQSILDIELEESEILRAVKRMENKLSIAIHKHSLEFFGLCKKCQYSP